MSSVSALMAFKVIGIVVLVAGIVWWQFHDLAQEKKREAEREAKPSDKAP